MLLQIDDVIIVGLSMRQMLGGDLKIMLVVDVISQVIIGTFQAISIQFLIHLDRFVV